MVPLFIKAPHQSSGVVDTTPARAIDVLPTVAAFLDVELPWLHEGRPLARSQVKHGSLEVQANEGGKVALANVVEGVSSASAYAQSIFGDPDGRIDPYSLGEYDALIDQAPEDVITASSDLDVRVEDLWRFAHVDPSSGVVPGLIRGEVIGELEPDTQVAIALNGRVGTTVPVQIDNGTAHFSAILSDDAFVQGFNELDLMAVSGLRESPVVQSIEIEGQYELGLEIGESGEVERLFDNHGRTWRLAEEPVMNGYVDATEWYPTDAINSAMADLVVVGWAVDKVEVRPAERVAFFVDGVFAGSTVPDIERRDIERAYNHPQALLSGFRGQVSHFSPAESCELRVFALSGGRAVELEVSERASSTFLGC
jgi:hypothetical protein